MILVACPTGCGAVRRPLKLRRELVRCANCTALFRIPERAEDASLVDGELVARPGESLAPARRRRRAWPWALVAAAALAFLGYGFERWRRHGGPAKAAAGVRAAPHSRRAMDDRPRDE